MIPTATRYEVVKLGIILGTWDGGEQGAQEILAVVIEAERCGYEIVWVPELYGAEAVSLMTWLGANTSRIRIGSAVMQIPARPPTTAAMAAVTLTALFGPRIVLGLGVSGPQVSEGWYGVPWEDPIGRARDYIEILRLAMARQPVQYRGQRLRLPLRDDQRPLKLVIKDPVPVPLYLAAIGPRQCAPGRGIGRRLAPGPRLSREVRRGPPVPRRGSDASRSSDRRDHRGLFDRGGHQR